MESIDPNHILSIDHPGAAEGHYFKPVSRVEDRNRAHGLISIRRTNAGRLEIYMGDEVRRQLGIPPTEDSTEPPSQSQPPTSTTPLDPSALNPNIFYLLHIQQEIGIPAVLLDKPEKDTTTDFYLGYQPNPDKKLAMRLTVHEGQATRSGNEIYIATYPDRQILTPTNKKKFDQRQYAHILERIASVNESNQPE